MTLHDKVDIVTVSRWLGHKDLATTPIYLRALEAEMAQPQVEQSTLAKQFGGRAPKVQQFGRKRDGGS
jgi:integrase